MNSSPLSSTRIRRYFLGTASAAILGASAVYLPGLSQVVLESLNPVTIAYGTLIAHTLTLVVLLPAGWCNRTNVYETALRLTRGFAFPVLCLASTFLGLAVGHGALYGYYMNPILFETAFLSLTCAVVFFAFGGSLLMLPKSFFVDFARSSAKRKLSARLLALLGLCVSTACLWTTLS